LSRNAVQARVSTDYLRIAIGLDETKRISGVKLDPFGQCYIFLIEGDDLPEVTEGSEPEFADIVVTTKPVIDKTEIVVHK
jgi:hypothetical protein